MVKQKIWSMGADAIVSADAEALQTKLSFQAEWKKKNLELNLTLGCQIFSDSEYKIANQQGS